MTNVIHSNFENLEAAQAYHQQFFTDYLESFASMRFDDWAERFWHPQGQFVVAYPIGGGSPIVGASREQILQNMKMLGSVVSFIRIDDLQVTQTSNPSQFIAQYQIQADYKNGT